MDHFELISNHFLNLPRPDVELGPPAGVVDTTTLAAHDFDIDTRTGFMPPQPPLIRLSDQWEAWEQALDDAQVRRLQLGRKPGITEDERNQSESWRAHIREVSPLQFRPSAADRYSHARFGADAYYTDFEIESVRVDASSGAPRPFMDDALLHSLTSPFSLLGNHHPGTDHSPTSSSIRPTSATARGNLLR